ncbi:reverse transcriptase domain-containing protein [Tanacetum coccineum]
MTSKATRNKEINETGININEPPVFEQDAQEMPNDDGVENKSLNIPERTTQPLVKLQQSSIPFPNWILLTNKSKLEEACTEIINERCSAVLLNELPLKEKDLGSHTTPCQEITDEFCDEHLMVLKSKSNNDEPWYANFINYIVGNVVPPNWNFEKRKRFFSQVKTYFWEESYAFKLCADNIMRRCVDGNETLEILAHYHSGPTGGHLSANVTAKKVYESGFYWPSVFKDANEYVRRCDSCQRLGNISSRNEMPQNNIQVCEVFDVWGLDFMGLFPQSKGLEFLKL